MPSTPFEFQSLERHPFNSQLIDLQSAQNVGHLESCDFCMEQEALSFAELPEYSRADVPGMGYFTDYYSVDRISTARVEMIRACILALCKSEQRCRGCGEAVEGGPYCDTCAREVESLIAKRSFELPKWAKCVFAGIGYLVVFLLFVFDLTAILAVWP